MTNDGSKSYYLWLLENSYQIASDFGGGIPGSRLEYLGESIFNFTTYDGEMSALFARKSIEVCSAITSRTTFEYIKDSENYCWYIFILNTVFFSGKLNWGTSIRGAWWNDVITLQNFNLWDEEKQMLEDIKFTKQEWEDFMRAASDFSVKP